LEAELSGYRMMEEEYSSLKLRHEDGVVRCNDLEGVVFGANTGRDRSAGQGEGVAGGNRAAVEESRAGEQEEERAAVLRRRNDPEIRIAGLRTCASGFIADNAMKQEYENKIGKLEDQLNSALHREEIFKGTSQA
jgi:hypothetical protein